MLKLFCYNCSHAWKLYENQKVVTLADQTMDVNPDDEKHVNKVIEIALLCTQSPASKRPAISEVVLMLSNDPSYKERQLTWVSTKLCQWILEF
ncbi:putative transferase [Helianthus anomalus]